MRPLAFSALLLTACIDNAFDDYCQAHNGCVTTTTSCTPGSGSACPVLSCLSLADAGSGAYWIDVRRDGGAPVHVFCDMTPGDPGWTLVAAVGAFSGDMSGAWLLTDHSTTVLGFSPPALPSFDFATVEAVPLAMASTEVRASADGPATRWVRWPLPLGRTAETLWRHDAGFESVEAAAASPERITAVQADGGASVCYQNPTGLSWLAAQGGAYPAAAADPSGDSQPGDDCLMVGTLGLGMTADGFTQGDGGIGYDAPSSEWPNPTLGVPPQLMIWLR